MSKPIITREQRMAQKAYNLVMQRKDSENESNYKQTATTFPALIHGNGLCQAVSFYNIPKKDVRGLYLADLAELLEFSSADEFAKEVRCCNLEKYMLISRLAMDAASWLKRYSQACLSDEEMARGEGL